jgi:hypothetical protein
MAWRPDDGLLRRQAPNANEPRRGKLIGNSCANRSTR